MTSCPIPDPARAVLGRHRVLRDRHGQIRAGIPVENVRTLMNHGGAPATAKFSHKAEVPARLRQWYRYAIELAMIEVAGTVRSGANV